MADRGLLFFNLAVLLEELIEQHRVHRVVTHGVDLAVLIPHHQVRIDLRYFLGDKPILRRVCLVALVVERHRVEAKDSFAGFLHGFDLLFEPARGANRAQLIGGVDQDWDSRIHRGCKTNVADKAAVAHVRTGVPDSNNVIGCSDPITGTKAQGDIELAVAVSERTLTNGCTLVPGGVVFERILTNGRVSDARGVEKERSITDGGVVAAAKTVIGEAEKGVLPFCGVASGITSIGRWNNRLRVLDERKADESNCD